MKTKLLTICLLLLTLFSSNVLSKNHQEIIGVWHIFDNTGGVRFDEAAFKRLIIFKDENLYKAIVIGYDWKRYQNCTEFQYDDGYGVETELDCLWLDAIRFIPTKYIENKISDFDSTENFTDNMKNKFCSFDENYDDNCTRSKLYISGVEYPFSNLAEKINMDCIQNNKNEVFSKDQKSFANKNYNYSNVPKIWFCIYPKPLFFSY